MIRIAVTGPESSGKTTLANQLAVKFNGHLVNEYAREYLTYKIIENSHFKYSIDDVVKIAKIQFHHNKADGCDRLFVICDTEMTVIKVWCEDKFGFCPKDIEDLFIEQQFDIIFLCKPDFPWQQDVLREDSLRRDILFHQYKSVLSNQKTRVVILEGDQEKRFKTAVNLLLG